MADIHFEIFDNADFGNKNLRFSEAPAQEQRDFLKQNGYGFTTRYGGVWYPRTKEAKDRNSDFVKEFAEKFYPESNQSQPQNQIERLAEAALENNPAEVNSPNDNRIAYLENLIAELKEERKRDQEKISRLEAALENQTEENIAELEMRQEQAELDDETEWEKENTLTEAEERAYLEKQSEIKIPAETIELTSEILDSLHETAEKESLADEPQAEKEILHDSEKSVDNNLTVSPKELAIAKSVLPTVQYVSTLKFAQGEEREFFVHKIKEIAAAVENAPKINATDGLEEHRIVLRYFHPSGTQSFVTEIGKDGDAFGFQCLNDDWENAEWGYLNIDELKNIRGMEVDFHVTAGMTVERFLYKEAPEQFPKYAKFTNKENAPAQNKKSPFDVAMETGNDIEAIAAQLKTYHTLKEEDVKDLEIISDEDFSDIVDSIILNDYRHIPNIIRLPNLNAELCEKLGLAKDSAFVMKKSTTHIRPNRKGNYEQAFDTEEYRLIPQVIREANFVLVDKRTQNFQVVFGDKDNISKINKIVFNKDELGNYIVTIGKVDRRDGISEKDNTVVGVGVAPTISALRFPEEQPATRLRPSPTTVNQNIPQTVEKSSLEELSSANETRITWDDILQAAEGSHWNDAANAVYNNARNQIAEYAKNLGVDIENSESPEEVIGTFAAAHEEISFSKDGSLVIDEFLKPIYFNNLTDEQKEEVINGYRSADDQQMLEENTYINSDEFISKFGDWNKANRLEKLRKADSIEKDEKIILNGNDITSTVSSLIENEDRKELQSLEKEIGRTILGTYQNDDTGIFVNVSNRNVTEISNHHYFFKEHIQSLAYIPEIIEKATFIAEVENEDKKKHPNIEKYLYFGTGLKLSGEDYTCKSVIGVDSSKNCYYDQSLSTIEKGRLVDYVMQNKKAGNLSPLMTQRETDLEGNEMPYVYYDKRLISVCQVPQLPYMEKLNEVWKPTKEAIELVKAGRLHIEKNGQEYVIIQANNETPVSELSSSELSRLSEEKKHILEQCNSIIEKYTNTHFSEQEQKVVNGYEKEDANRHQVLMSLCNIKYVHCTTKDKYGYWEINKGKEISVNEVRRLMSYDDFASGVDRASFHITAGRTANDGSFIYFNDSERKRDIQPYELSKEDIELLSKYEEAGGLKENIPKSVLEQLSKSNNDLTAQNKKDYSFEEYWKNSVSGMTMQDVKDGKVHIINIDKKERENVRSNLQSQDIAVPRTKSDLRKIREQCREILKKPDSEITEADKKILAQYEGGGGLNENNRTNSEVLNAFYTPDNLIEKLWELVDAYAPDAKTVLEPSAGVGKFANNRPDNKFTMHELNETSARINKILHPEADVIQGAFQKQFLDDGERFLKIGYEQLKHDVVIGNPPYGKYNDKYKGLGEGREFDRYEEYFIARGLEALKDENSVLAFVVPSGFLNTASDKQKSIIASKGEILDAYRLPEGTFSTTEVGTDILIMRKKESLDDRKNISSELLSDGEWFKNHPEKILGEVKTRTNRFGKKEEYVAVHEGLSVQDELNKIDSFVDEIKKANQTEKKEAEKSFETQLDEYNRKYWGPVGPGDTRYDISPVTEERLSEIKTLSKELSEYFENGVRPENDRFVIGKTPRVLQETGSEYTDVTVSVSVVKKAVETHGLSEKEILNALTRLATPILVFDSDKNATENKVESKLVLTDVFKDENPVALAVNVNDSVQKQENGHRKQIEVQNIRSIHDRTVVAKNGVDLIRKWTDDGLCRYVDDKKITDWSTIARVQFPIEVLQSDNSNILTRTSLVNSVSSEQAPLEENEKTEPEKNNASPKARKEKWNISKSKGDVMTAEEFSHLYGRDFDEREFPIWKATDWQGNIDLSKLSGDDIQYLSESGKYVEKNFGEWTHKELFTSGDIYAKIQEQRELYVKSDGNRIFADNIKLLESAMKSPLEIEKIHFGVKTALAETFTVEHIDAEGNKVNLNLQESFILWAQNAKLADRKWRGDVDFATANISREELGEELSFYDIVNYIDGKPVKAEAVRGWRTYDMSEDEKAAEKAERRKEADLKRQARSDTANRLFDRYLHEGLSKSDTKRLSAEYNRRFNSYIAPDYSKLPLFVDGMSAYKGDSKFKLYDQQIKGISFLCNKGNGLLAYDVGVGKTAAGIVATVNQIQTGRSKRPLIIVPNQVYSKWYTDIRQLFPNIKVNDLYNFGKDSVEKYIDSENLHRLNIPENSISLCTYEALKNITFTDESCENELYEDFASLLSADMDGNARDNAESSDKIKGIIGSASHVKDESYFFYEDCGFDNLTVDEAHNFKNLWVVPRPKKKGESNEYAGIPSGKPSARALKMYGMTQLTQRRNDDRNVFMLTATPFTNSPTEVYSMLSYVGRERLKQAGITSLRAFFDEFAQTKQELGVTSTGNIDTKQVMKSWKELSALQNILTEFIDKVDGEEAGIIRPNKFTHVKPLDMSDLQKKMREIDEERMADVKKGDSAAVIVAMNNMRLSCVAPALANPDMYPGIELPPLSKLVETSPKLKFVCDAIIDMYKGNPEKGQFMYVPLGKESHGIIKDYLVAHGIPKNAVEIINGEVNNTPEKKEKITSCFNDEKNPYKIIIGGRNTAEGIDLNGNSFSMYNCSLGWNPSETIQAEGRIWRQGNLQGNVHIVYPVMNDSIDSVLYQKHDEKRSRINELWNYKGDSLNVEDINPEDLKLDLIKDPNKKAKLILQEETKEARAELSRLNLKIKSFDEIIEKRKQFELDFSDAKEIVDYQKKQIESYKESGLEVPEWIKSELKDCNKKFSKAETGLEKVNEKLSSLKITDSEKEAKYIHSLNNQKHACEEKINNIENTLPQILKKLEIERMEQKLIEYPVEKQREILEADILNNLRPMKEVEYEIKTMRHEAMLSEKLKAGEISEEEFSLYKNAGYEKYEKWLNGEIESLEENTVKNESTKENSSIKNENDIEKIIVYYDGHWADERGEKGKGWKYQEKSFDNPKDALEFYNTAKIPKDVGAENKNGFRFNFMNPEERLLELISEHDKTVSVQNESVSENTAVEKPAQTDLERAAEKTENAKQPEQDMDSLYADSGSLFFGFNDSDILSVHSPENEYRKSEPYDDFSITERQLTESELKRDEIIFPVLNGKESGMYKSFKDFAEHGVFDVQGKSVELDDSGRISETGWSQLQAAMEIYRNKQFETFRYVLINRENGEIKDQLAVKSYSPNRCAVSTPDLQTIKQVITRAEELDCMVAAVHNHPSGNTAESSFDAELTESLKRALTNGNGLCRFAGHIILDHDTFNLYTPQNGWKIKLNSNAYGNSEDKLLNKNFAFLKDSVDYTWQLENVAKKINDKNNWNDNFIPVVFADSLNHVSGIKLYDKSFFDNEPQKIRNELQFSGLEANSVKAFPVITKNFAETMSAVDELLFEDKLKNLVEHSAFIDAALPESTVTEKFNILPGRQYFDVHGAKIKNPDIEATWQTRINPALFSEPEQRTMRKKEVAFER